MAVFCLWTIVFWTVRGGGLLFGDHDVGFKVVHTVLALASIGLAGALHRVDREGAPQRGWWRARRGAQCFVSRRPSAGRRPLVCPAMGQPITVVTKPSSRAGGFPVRDQPCPHRYGALNASRPTTRYWVIRRLTSSPGGCLPKGGIANLHVNGNVITVEFSDTGVDGVEEIISGVYLYWVEGVEVPSDDELTGAVG
ncbi:MAG: hypothetical protein Ct9H300mP12_02320 [Acidimicrobiales bacterium]|nr:MAG: hypothetical protein Ct9H300mP12_02320 [Acidimicrobiales bacterium]